MYFRMTTATAETLESPTIIVSDTSRIEPPLKMTKAFMVRKYRQNPQIQLLTDTLMKMMIWDRRKGS